MERQVAALFGKSHGVMCNSGSSALYLALELLDLPPGRRGRHVRAHVLDRHRTDRARRLGARCSSTAEPDHLLRRRRSHRGDDHARTGAMLFPNLIGNAPDWDRIAEIAERHGLPVIEDSCDTLGATLAGHADRRSARRISVTSFANSHIITCGGNGGMVMPDDDDAARPRADAASVGTPLGAALLRIEAARPRLLGRPRRHPLRQPVHLRRAGVELRAVGDGRRVRARAAGEAAAEPGAAAAHTSTATPSSSRGTPTGSRCRGSSTSSRPRGSATR